VTTAHILKTAQVRHAATRRSSGCALTYARGTAITPFWVIQLCSLIAQLGAYNTVNFFRVDKGFVLQCTDIVGNRLVPLDARQQANLLLTLLVFSAFFPEHALPCTCRCTHVTAWRSSA